MADDDRPRPQGGGGSRQGGGSGSHRRRRGGRRRSGQGSRQGGAAAQPTSTTRAKGAGGGGRRSTGSRSGGQRRRGRPTETFAPASPPSARVPSTQTLTPDVGVAPRLVGDHEMHANHRRARLITLLGGFGPALIVGVVVGAVASALAGAIAGAAVLAVAAVVIPRIATRFTLWLLGARAVGEDEFARLQNLVDGLCPTFGVRRPRLMSVDDELPNACAVGSRPDRSFLVVTTGLEAALGLIELEGVIGHELAHLKRWDSVVSSVAVTVLAPFTWLTGSDRLLHRALGFGRELRADQLAVRAVRYPPGLRDALSRVVEAPSPRPGSIFASRRLSMSRWLWIDPAVGRRSVPTAGDLDLTSTRIEALAEL